MSYKPESVSLPGEGFELGQLWGGDGCEFVYGLVHNQLLPPDQVEARLRQAGVSRAHSDPLLRVKHNYIDFIKRLWRSNLIDVDTDCLGRIELDPDAEEGLTICTADLKDAFYHLSLPRQLRKYFALRPVMAKDLGLLEVNGRPVRPGTLLTPRLAVVPMGWSWALYVCQQLHQRVVERSGLGSDVRLRDRHPVSSTSCCHLQYVDNLVVLGTDREMVKGAFERAVKELTRAGLQVHEVESSSDGAQVLGWHFTANGEFRPTRKRCWRVRLALREVLKRGHATSKEMQKLIGHCGFISMGRRESPSCFGRIYDFIKTHEHNSLEHPLGKHVRQELSNWDGILPLIRRDLKAAWSTKLLATDASEWGLGATQSDIPYEQAKSIGQFCERWRFKDPLTANPRQRTMAEFELPFCDVPSCIKQDDRDAPHDRVGDFASVPFEVVNQQWQTIGRHRWQRELCMPVAEAQAVLFGVKHALRNMSAFGKKHLILTDSMTVACAVSRGRSHGFQLRRVIQQIAAHSLVTNSEIHLRWIPSEWNPADSPSRGGWVPSVPQQLNDPPGHCGARGGSHGRSRRGGRLQHKLSARPHYPPQHHHSKPAGPWKRPN